MLQRVLYLLAGLAFAILTCLLLKFAHNERKRTDTLLLLVAGAVSGFLLAGGGYPVYLLRLIAAFVVMGAAALCDFRTRKIPNILSLEMIGTAIVCCVADAVLQDAGILGFLGGLLAGAVVFAVLVLFRVICSLLLHKPGLGWGDIKLISALAVLTGVDATIQTILFAQLAALVIVLILLLLKKVSIKSELPFAPFLFLGYAVSVLFLL